MAGRANRGSAASPAGDEAATTPDDKEIAQAALDLVDVLPWHDHSTCKPRLAVASEAAVEAREHLTAV